MVNFLLYGNKESCDLARYEFTLKYMGKENADTVKVFFLFLALVENNKNTVDSDTICEYLNLSVESMAKALERLVKCSMISTQLDEEKNFLITIKGYKGSAPDIVEVVQPEFDEQQYQKEEKLNELFFVSEGILRRVLLPTEMETIQYLIDELVMPTDKVIELIRFMKSNHKGKLQNLISFAIRWKEKEYRPIEEVFGLIKIESRTRKNVKCISQDYGDMDALEKELLEMSMNKLKST